MSGFVRRVVTGHDENGKAIVLSDGLVERVYSNPVRPGHRSSDIWETHAMPVKISREEADPVAVVTRFLSPLGVKIRISELEPEPESVRNLDPGKAAQWYKDSGHPASSSFGKGGRHPLLHRTETIDYAVVLEGQMTLVMDDKEIVLNAGDVVVQRGTNHAWSNRSSKRVRMLYILIDGKFDDELAGLFEARGER
jgi:mannose-6-phosphate isomerase-like protein (cupin superfamily)